MLTPGLPISRMISILRAEAPKRICIGGEGLYPINDAKIYRTLGGGDKKKGLTNDIAPALLFNMLAGKVPLAVRHMSVWRPTGTPTRYLLTQGSLPVPRPDEYSPAAALC